MRSTLFSLVPRGLFSEFYGSPTTVVLTTHFHEDKSCIKTRNESVCVNNDQIIPGGYSEPDTCEERRWTLIFCFVPYVKSSPKQKTSLTIYLTIEG